MLWQLRKFDVGTFWGPRRPNGMDVSSIFTSHLLHHKGFFSEVLPRKDVRSGALSAFFSRVCSPPGPRRNDGGENAADAAGIEIWLFPLFLTVCLSQFHFMKFCGVQEILSYNWKFLVPFLLAFFRFSSHHFNPWTVAVQPLNGGVACVEWWLQVEFHTYRSTSHHQKKVAWGKKVQTNSVT